MRSCRCSRAVTIVASTPFGRDGALHRIRSPVTTVAREAIESWTAEQERQAQHDAIRAYAEAMAGSPADLDETLEEAAALACLDASS